MVSGRWSFSSGCMGADVVGVGIAPFEGDKGGLPRMAVMPRSQARIEMAWDVSGSAGTGSHDLVVDKVIVPEDWTFARQVAAQRADVPLPSLSFAAQVLTVVGLGIARAAIEELRGMATGRPRSPARRAWPTAAGADRDRPRRGPAARRPRLLLRRHRRRLGHAGKG
jgi:alkylation response protein AidB-like acyl-CoA dehydrogenase